MEIVGKKRYHQGEKEEGIEINEMELGLMM